MIEISLISKIIPYKYLLLGYNTYSSILRMLAVTRIFEEKNLLVLFNNSSVSRFCLNNKSIAFVKNNKHQFLII